MLLSEASEERMGGHTGPPYGFTILASHAIVQFSGFHSTFLPVR